MNARAVVLPALVLIAAVVIWRAAVSAAEPPAATWRIGTGIDLRHGRNFEQLPAESPIRLSYSGHEPCHVYVFSHSAEDGTLLLFPSPQILGSPKNPLPAGRTVLPGSHDGKELAWTTRSGVLAATTFLVVASRAPVPELETLAPRLRRWTNSVFPDRSMQLTMPPDLAEPAGGPRRPLPGELLPRAQAAGFDQPDPNGPLVPDRVLDGVWIGSWKVRERPAAVAPAPTPAPVTGK